MIKQLKNQNVTLSLPKNLLREAKKIAIDRDTSLSKLLADLLTDLVEKSDEYEAAKHRQLELTKRGHDLGLNGQTTWTRDELHDRKC